MGHARRYRRFLQQRAVFELHVEIAGWAAFDADPEREGIVTAQVAHALGTQERQFPRPAGRCDPQGRAAGVGGGRVIDDRRLGRAFDGVLARHLAPLLRQLVPNRQVFDKVAKGHGGRRAGRMTVARRGRDD